MNKPLPRVAITMGDPAGIGPELCLRVLADTAVRAACAPVVFGDAGVLGRVGQACNLPIPESVLPADAFPARAGQINRPTIVDCQAIDAAAVEPGKISGECGRAAFAYIDRAIAAALAGQVVAVATAPLHKEALRAAGLCFPGHTEIFAKKTSARRICMMLTADEITVSLVTTHVGYREACGGLSIPRVLDVMELTAEAMSRLRARPARLVVCGLNPHAGEHGLFGQGEEETILAPAVEQARSRGLDVIGPLSPDTAFVPARRRETDAYICMYHDQGLIPLKMLSFGDAVNVTLGLPIVRTSVDHGTAFDIAWTGRAQASSLVRAVQVALKLAQKTPLK
ncbi:MAG: 4-hydroxythreonine-4-phosphate dehydrogenase PdxA [Pirellulales bacterium]|nr:4-hydroxythreonine-4-phosphate dehydrogenase PdxA [Pirellulales bacterium]